VRAGGMSAIVSTVPVRWFTAAFMRQENGAIDQMRQVLADTSPEGYIACCEAIRDMDQRVILSRIRAATLVIAGALDAVSPPADGRSLANAITGARYVELNAAHLTNIEAAEAFTDTVMRFLTGGMEGD
jgi:3-oxoadipate enol-lactonase